MIEKLLESLKSAILTRVENVSVKIALDSYDVLEKINDAAGCDIVIIDVGQESPLGNYPEIAVCEFNFDIYVARSFGLSELKDNDFFRRNANDKPLWILRNLVREAVRNAVIPNWENVFETPYFTYNGAKKFETPFNLRASSFILNFKIIGKLPEINNQQY